MCVCVCLPGGVSDPRTMSDLPDTFVAGWHDEAEVRKMKFRTLPHYGKVSVISFGASGLGGMFTAGQATGITQAKAGEGAGDVWFAEDADADKEAARNIVHMCLKAGVNVIDTSHWYGQGRSERLLGHALKDVPRQAYYINSKIGRYDKDPMLMFDFSYDKTYQARLPRPPPGLSRPLRRSAAPSPPPPGGRGLGRAPAKLPVLH